MKQAATKHEEGLGHVCSLMASAPQQPQKSQVIHYDLRRRLRGGSSSSDSSSVLAATALAFALHLPLAFGLGRLLGRGRCSASFLGYSDLQQS